MISDRTKVTRIAVGSTNRAKVNAVRRIVSQVWPEAEIVPVAVLSGVGEMPLSDDEGARGARQRAEAARQALDADLGIGLEGAAHDENGTLYICNWAAVASRDGRCSVALGGRLPLPEIMAAELRAGGELGPIIDRFTGQRDTKQDQGASGFLTRGLIKRDEGFRVAVAFALAPFLNPELY